nr:putative LAGLIDADG homing endonuclease [Oedogonium sp. 244]
MDGDGSIQVNHWRAKSLQYRIIIKFKNTAANEQMLLFLCDQLKAGHVRLDKRNGSVIFVIFYKNNIINLIKIFEKHPPLTTRLQCQLFFYCFAYKEKALAAFNTAS